MRRWLAVLAFTAVVTAACGSDEGNGGDALASSSSPSSSTTTATPTSGDDLPGEKLDLYPYQGAKLAVVGVEHGDKLQVRSGPGTEFEPTFDLAPTAMNIVATGHNRSRPGSIWSEIEVDGRLGWANTAYLLQPGDVNDITAELYPTPAERPTAETLLDLGRMVGSRRAGDDPEAKVVIVEAPTEGDLGEVTVDVIGLGDDSVGGERLKIFAEPGSGRYTLRTVEATTFCRRGVSSDRLCV